MRATGHIDDRFLEKYSLLVFCRTEGMHDETNLSQ